MADTSEHRTPAWAAFLAGAVTMLIIVLLWMAWVASRSAVTATLRAQMALRRAELPLPTTPPPEGPRLPKPPVPAPR
jgi:hypothetical protein